MRGLIKVRHPYTNTHLATDASYTALASDWLDVRECGTSADKNGHGSLGNFLLRYTNSVYFIWDFRTSMDDKRMLGSLHYQFRIETSNAFGLNEILCRVIHQLFEPIRRGLEACTGVCDIVLQPAQTYQHFYTT